MLMRVFVTPSPSLWLSPHLSPPDKASASEPEHPKLCLKGKSDQKPPVPSLRVGKAMLRLFWCGSHHSRAIT